MLAVKKIVCKVSTTFGNNKQNRGTDIDTGKVIKATGETFEIEIGDLSINTELFFCDDKETFFDHWTESFTGSLNLPKLYSPDELYKLIIKCYEISQWIHSPYSHCVEIEISDDDAKHTLVVGKDDCTGCSIYDSLVTAMMVALYSKMFYSKSTETLTVYGILILTDRRMKVYKSNSVNTGATPVTLYRSSGVNIQKEPQEVSDLIEYMFKHTFEGITNPL